jgi:hypothetical protein
MHSDEHHSVLVAPFYQRFRSHIYPLLRSSLPSFFTAVILTRISSWRRDIHLTYMPNFAHTFPHSFSSKRPDGLWCCLHTYQTHASLRAAQLSTLPPTIYLHVPHNRLDADLVYRRFDISHWYKHRGANNSCHGRFCRLILGTSVCPHCVVCVCVCVCVYGGGEVPTNMLAYELPPPHSYTHHVCVRLFGK